MVEIQIEDKKYVLASMGYDFVDTAKSIYFFELNSNYQIINLNRVKIGERIRDIKVINSKIYMFLEDSPSIGIIQLKR